MHTRLPFFEETLLPVKLKGTYQFNTYFKSKIMKKINLKRNFKGMIIMFLFTLVTGPMVNAQTVQEEIDYIQSIFGMEKKEALTDFLVLQQSASFWDIYNEYEIQRKELGKKRLNLLNNYISNYDSMGDEGTDDIIKQAQTQKKSLDKLINQYYKKIKKDSGSKTAAQFYQFENYLLSAIRYGIFESIPLFGE
jgi:hypothetical protein